MLFKGSDFRDWFIILLVAAAWMASTVFLFHHPEAPNFVTWSGLCATMGSIYHFLVIRDSKTEDRC